MPPQLPDTTSRQSSTNINKTPHILSPAETRFQIEAVADHLRPLAASYKKSEKNQLSYSYLRIQVDACTKFEEIPFKHPEISVSQEWEGLYLGPFTFDKI